MSLIPQPNIIIDANHSKVTYQPEFLTDLEAQSCFDYFLSNLIWSHDEARIYGKTTITNSVIKLQMIPSQLRCHLFWEKRSFIQFVSIPP
jgi:hypothetical protein